MAAASTDNYRLMGGESNSDDMFALDWGGEAGACWEIWRVEPCCKDLGSAVYCCACWWFCGLCSASKLFSYSVKQDCAIVNHCLPVCFCGICTATCMRHNIRSQLHIGDTVETKGWVGDCLLMWCCGPCSMCQIIRAVPTEAWDWLPNVSSLKVMVDPFTFITKDK